MPTRLPTLLFFALCLVFIPPSFAQNLPIGAPLPDEARTLELAPVAVDPEAVGPDITAADITPRPLADWRREAGLLVIFAANTCPYVTDWADRFPRLAALGQERGIGVVVVNSNARKRKTDDSPEAMADFAREHLGGLPYLLDEGSKLADLLGAERTPEALLFDGEWKLVYRGQVDDHSGPFAEVEEHYLRDAMGALLGEGPMPEATPPLGCKILRPRQRRPRPSDP